jgi:error-prone DNA polymerase
MSMRNGARVRYAGLVICRQRPGTASGVVFMTLEDESGFVNVVLWPKVFAANAVTAKTTTFLGVHRQASGPARVTHLIAEEFRIPRVEIPPQHVRSRDSH